MSRGTWVTTLRIPDKLRNEMYLTIEQRNLFTRGEPWTTTGFILSAIREKIDKMSRSRRGRASKKAPVDEQPEADD